VSAVAFDTPLAFEHRLRSTPTGREDSSASEAARETNLPTHCDIQPWELHSELAVVCAEVSERARELLPKRDPDVFLARSRESASTLVAATDAVARPPELPIAVVGYTLWRLAETVRSAFVAVIAVVALALLAELLH
jgi:hypothetical protein